MDEKIAQLEAIAKKEDIPATVLRRLIDDWKATRTENTAHETTSRAAVESHQLIPSEARAAAADENLSVGDLRKAIDKWRAAAHQAETSPVVPCPAAKWMESREKILGKKRGIVTFLEREWEPFIQKSGQVVTRDILARHDPDAEWAYTRYVEKHGFPKGISIIYPNQLEKLAIQRPDLVRATLPAKQEENAQQATTQAADAALAKVKGDATLVRQWQTYNRLLTAVVLPPDRRFRTLEEAKKGTNLVSTYKRARVRQAKLGVELLPENDEFIRKVSGAASAFYQKAKPISLS